MISNSGYGIIENGAIAVTDSTIVWIGKGDLVPELNAKKTLSLPGKWASPALIDCHTHIVFAGNRAWEFEDRLKGKSYQEISKSGGGIISTVNETRKSSSKDLLKLAKNRLIELQSEGVGTVEIKSGYGLDLATEKKMLEVAKKLENEPVSYTHLTLPTICSV